MNFASTKSGAVSRLSASHKDKQAATSTKPKPASKDLSDKAKGKKSVPKSISNKSASKKTKSPSVSSSSLPKESAQKKRGQSVSPKNAVKKSIPTKKATNKESAPKSDKQKVVLSNARSRVKTPIKKGGASTKTKSTPRKPPKILFPKTQWGSESSITFEATEYLPPVEQTCIAGGYVFHEDKLVMANVPGRGWEIIGGRIDVGEHPEETFRREALNQLGATLSYVQMIGVIRIEHTGPEPPNCPYPFPIGYGVQFIGVVEKLQPFSGGEDSLGRSLISPDGVKHHYFEWDEYAESVFKYACDMYQRWKKRTKQG